MKNKTKIIIKFLLAAMLYIVLSTVMGYYTPVIDGSVAVGQLHDSYSSNATVGMWNDLKKFWGYGYVLMVLLLFSGNIKNLLMKIINKEERIN